MDLYELTKEEINSLKTELEERADLMVREIVNEKMESIVLANRKLSDAYKKKNMYKLKLEDELKKSEELLDRAYGLGRITEASYRTYKYEDCSFLRRVAALQVCLLELERSSSEPSVYLKMLDIIKKDKSEFEEMKYEIKLYEKHYRTRISYVNGFILELRNFDIASRQSLVDGMNNYLLGKRRKQLGHMAREKIMPLIRYFMVLNHSEKQVEEAREMIDSMNAKTFSDTWDETYRRIYG